MIASTLSATFQFNNILLVNYVVCYQLLKTRNGSTMRRSTRRSWRLRKPTTHTECSRRWADVRASFRQQWSIRTLSLETSLSGAVTTTWAWHGIPKSCRPWC